ncbi:MAG: FeoA family protein [Sedimenticola sp.]
MSSTILSTLKPGEKGKIIRVDGESELKRRLATLGFRCGATVGVLYSALLGDPKTYLICGCQVSLRKSEAKHIFISS